MTYDNENQTPVVEKGFFMNFLAGRGTNDSIVRIDDIKPLYHIGILIFHQQLMI